mmetsp:Transcript_24352/g.55553  ORF Transcript_24352/g.55553 Transcript_24352/m.55553 type:complete len:318 (-) Transcript_24352:1981-2934(-)
MLAGLRVNLDVVRPFVGAYQLHHDGGDGGLGHVLVRHGVEAARCVVDIDPDEDGGGGEGGGHVDPPDAGAAFGDDLAGGALEDDVTLADLAVVAAVAVVVVVEIYELGEVTCFSEDLFYERIGVVRGAVVGRFCKVQHENIFGQRHISQEFVQSLPMIVVVPHLHLPKDFLRKVILGIELVDLSPNSAVDFLDARPQLYVVDHDDVHVIGLSRLHPERGPIGRLRPPPPGADHLFPSSQKDIGGGQHGHGHLDPFVPERESDDGQQPSPLALVCPRHQKFGDMFDGLVPLFGSEGGDLGQFPLDGGIQVVSTHQLRG